MRERSEPEVDQFGKLIGAFGVIQDITDRKTIEQNLSSSEERLRLALDAAGMAVWDLDLRTDKTIWNGSVLSHAGLRTGRNRTQRRYLDASRPSPRTQTYRGHIQRFTRAWYRNRQ